MARFIHPKNSSRAHITWKNSEVVSFGPSSKSDASETSEPRRTNCVSGGTVFQDKDSARGKVAQICLLTYIRYVVIQLAIVTVLRAGS